MTPEQEYLFYVLVHAVQDLGYHLQHLVEESARKEIEFHLQAIEAALKAAVPERKEERGSETPPLKRGACP